MQQSKRVLFVLNAVGGGATQGIKEYLVFQQNIEAYLALPTTPNSEQLKWIEQYTSGYIVCPMPWWNFPNGLPAFYRLLLYIKNWWIGKGGKKGAGIIGKYIIEKKIDFVYTGSILIREGAIAAKAKGIPHFWHIKETFGSKGRVKFLMSDKKLQRYITENSQSVICMTQYIKSFFDEGLYKDKVTVIHDGVNPEIFFDIVKSKRHLIREKWRIQDELILVGMVASLSSIWKNHSLFIEAAGYLREDGRFRFIAFGPEPKQYKNPLYNIGYQYYKRLQKTVHVLDLQDKFIWAGFYNDIPAIFQGLDILAHPCETEPFGRIIIEGIASGTSVIVPESGGAVEPVQETGIGITFKPNDADSLAKAIILAANSLKSKDSDSDIFEKLAANGYTLSNYVNSMNNLFNG